MKEYSALALEQMLEFMYMGEITESFEPILHIAQLWALGDKYNVYGRHEYIDRVQGKYITLVNVIAVFTDADACNILPLKDYCLGVMGKDLKKLLEEMEMVWL